MAKKILSLVLILVLCVSMLPASAMAGDEDICVCSGDPRGGEACPGCQLCSVDLGACLGTVDTDDTGDIGDAGDTGDIGDADDTGDIGDAGDTGDIGDADDTGDIGDADDTGDIGDAGDTGDIGDAGDTGDTAPLPDNSTAIAYVQGLIDALPDAVSLTTADYDTVSAQMQAITDAIIHQLNYDTSGLDLTRYNAVLLAFEQGLPEPETLPEPNYTDAIVVANVAPEGSGNVLIVSDSQDQYYGIGYFYAGDMIACHPIANDGYLFERWELIDSHGIPAPIVGGDLIFEAAAETYVFVAHFTEVYTAAVSSVPANSSASLDRTFNLDAGTVINLTISPDDGYEFKEAPTVAAVGAECGDINANGDGTYSCALTVSGNTTVTVSGEAVPVENSPSPCIVDVDITPGEGGSVSFNTVWTIGTYAHYYRGDKVILTAAPAQGYQFAGWELIRGYIPDGTDMSGSVLEFECLRENYLIRANFSALTNEGEYTVTVRANEGGTASASVHKATAGTLVTLSATPEDGYSFQGWHVHKLADLIIENDSFIMPAENVDIDAIFSKNVRLYTGGTARGVYGTALADADISGLTVTDEDGNNVPGGWEFVYPDTLIDSMQSLKVKADFTPADTSKYGKLRANVYVVPVKASLTVKADDKSIIKGEALPELSYTVSGLVNGDTLTAEPQLATEADKDVTGSYDITVVDPGTPTNPDCYTVLSVDGTLTVYERELQTALVIEPISPKTYGDPSFTITVTGGSGAGTVSLSSSDPAVVSLSGNNGDNTFTATIRAAGPVTLTAKKALDNNYSEATATLSLTIAKRPLTVTANNVTIGRGGTPGFSYSIEGLVPGDIYSGPVYALDSSFVNYSIPGTYTISITGETLTNAGSYIITRRSGILTIDSKPSQAPLYIYGAANKTYGDANFYLSVIGGSGMGAVTLSSSDPSVLSISGPYNGYYTAVIRKAGTVQLTATKAGDANFAPATATAMINIARKTLYVTANSVSVPTGAAMPAFTYSVNGLVYGDSFTNPTIIPTTASTAVAGIYYINISGGTLSNADCYNVVYQRGMLTVGSVYGNVYIYGGGYYSSGAGSYAAGSTVAVSAGIRNGYTFRNWTTSGNVVLANPYSPVTTFIMPAGDVYLQANWYYSALAPKTGDDNNPGLLLSLAALGVAGAFGSYLALRKRRVKGQQ